MTMAKLLKSKSPRPRKRGRAMPHLSQQQMLAGLKPRPTRQDLIHGLFDAFAAINIVAGDLNQRGGFDTGLARVLMHMALFQVEQAATELRDRPRDLLS
jgi:hypothetical protein